MLTCDRCRRSSMSGLQVWRKSFDFENMKENVHETVDLCQACYEQIVKEFMEVLKSNRSFPDGTVIRMPIEYILPPAPTTTLWNLAGLLRIGLAGIFAGIISFGTLLGLQWLMHHIH